MWEVPSVFLLLREVTYDSFRADFYATRRWSTASLCADIHMQNVTQLGEEMGTHG